MSARARRRSRRWPQTAASPRRTAGLYTAPPPRLTRRPARPEGTIDPWLKTLSFWDGDKPLRPELLRRPPDELLRPGRGLGRLRRAWPAGPARGLRRWSRCTSRDAAATSPRASTTTARRRTARCSRPAIEKGDGSKPGPPPSAPAGRAAFRPSPCGSSPGAMPVSPKDLTRRLTDDPRPFGQCLAAWA